ncbi:anthrone oxygenase family protein [Nocardiopsis chromatogenes]|uniref:anthrone oxygenase family protein n=1 Tax=Nocardiopsis chromatogenes TaxID=280239 RepID=UPI00034B1F7D|nr:anthrone oxygenase family protein [Nocardiopsis chromatogenes]
MAEFWQLAVAVAALLATGVYAGLFFAFTVGVMPGLRGVGAQVFVGAMQSINRAIVNPVFLVVFLGAPVLALVTAVSATGAGGVAAVAAWAAFALVAAVFVVTVALNIPLNDALEAAGPVEGTEAEAARRAFEAPWVRWNAVRTVLSAAGAACLAVSVAVG